jgi:hypothetical protein
MKTLIESTNTSATYQFSSPVAERTFTLHANEGEKAPDFEPLAENEYQRWLVWLGINE